MDFTTFKKEYEHKPVREFPNEAPANPLVSVGVQTYRQVDYIRDCLDGILMQETDFPFEILVGEDDSSDGTREICLEYAKKHPQKIRLFQHHRENNIKVQGKPSSLFNALYNWLSARGSYIAVCEGDDFWTDPLKLQKQVDILENNPNISLVAGGYTSLDIKTGEQKEIIAEEDSQKEKKQKQKGAARGYAFTLEESLQMWLTKTLTVMFRKDLLMGIDISDYKNVKDSHLYFHLLKAGDGFYMTENLGTYRIHDGGVFSSLSYEGKMLSNFYAYFELYRFNGDEPARKNCLRYLHKLLKYYSYHKVQQKNVSRGKLIGAGLRLTKEPREIISLLKGSVPFINKVSVFKGK